MLLVKLIIGRTLRLDRREVLTPLKAELRADTTDTSHLAPIGFGYTVDDRPCM